MRPRSPLRLLARMLGYSAQPPRPKRTVAEDVNNVGYFVNSDPIPRTSQEKLLQEIASL